MTTQTCIHHIFSAVARQVPDKPAVVCQGQQITYGRLEARSDRIASALLARETGPQARIGLFMPPETPFIAAMIGVLKSGAIYMPLDINDPAPRTAAILQNSRPELIITLAEFEASLPDQVPRILLDAQGRVMEEAPHLQLPRESTAYCQMPSAIAFIIHTSGSTGIPKGIPISHQAILNLLDQFDRLRKIGIRDRCSLWAGLNFDASVYEMWSALVSGASLHIPEETTRFDPRKFLIWMGTEQITSAFVPPFMISDLAGLEPMPVSLKRLLTGVSAIPADLLHDIREKIPGLCLVNGYGPAEATVCATLYTVPDRRTGPGSAPIGKAIQNLEVYLLDPEGNPVQDGEKGEICISGIQVARGYVGNPSLSEKAFVKNPFDPSPGSLMYRTGDVGYRLDDGNLMFVGRRDFQIKFKGVRIEPGDVENVLMSLPGIAQAAVVQKKGNRETDVLAAYIDGEFRSADVMAVLTDRLPRYMLPSRLIPLSPLPQTPQGKIDRKALISREEAIPGTAAGPAAGTAMETATGTTSEVQIPETEKKIRGIWEAVLDTRPLTGDSHFLLLGGDSISGTRIVSRIHQDLNRRIPLNQLFRNPVLSSFAAAVEKAAPSPFPKLVPTAASDAPLLEDQKLIWLFEQLNPGTTVYHIPFVFRLTTCPDIPVLEAALGFISRRHPALSTVFRFVDGQPVQMVREMAPEVVREKSPVPIPETLEPEKERETAIGEWLQTQIARAFDLETGPLFRTAVLTDDADGSLVCFTFHHLIFDGWSAGRFIKELNQVYTQLAGAETVTLPDRTDISFYDYARNAAGLRRQDLADAQRFCRRFLRDLPPAVEPEKETGPAATYPLELNSLVYDRIRKKARDHQTSPFTVLMAFIQLLLFTRTQEADQVTGFAHNGRDQAETEELIGFLMKTLVLRTRVNETASFSQFLERVKENLGEVFQFSHLSIRHLDQICRQNRGPVFQAMFFMQTMDLPALDIDGNNAPFLGLPTGSMNTDIILELYERDASASGHFKYRTDIYSREDMAEWVQEFQYIVHALLDDPDSPMDKVLDLNHFPLSPMQHGMLMETLRAPQGAGAYIEQVVITIQQEMDVYRFKQAWERIVQRHDAMRLGFIWQGLERPVQYLLDDVSVHIEYNDWCHFTDTEKQEYLDMFLQADRRLGFALNNPPVFRIALFKTELKRYTCVWSFHHAILDGRSMVQILRDLFREYRDPGAGPARSGSFKHYILWLNQQSQKAARKFWTRKLAGFTTPMLFPFRLGDSPADQNRRQQHAMTLATGFYEATLSPITSRKMKQICQENGFTMNAFLMGAWAVLLSHYTSRTDILFGATISVRNYDAGDMEKTGLYINTLPVRIRVRPDQPLTEFIRDIRKEWRELRQYEHYSLADIHACSPIKGSLPLSEIFFSYDYQSLDGALEPHKKLISCSRVNLLERTPAGIFLSAKGQDELVFTIEYDKRKFNAATIQQILSHFSVFLKSAVENPRAKLTDIPVLTESETRSIAEMLNTFQRHLRTTSCIHHLIEIQSSLNRDMLAVTDGSIEMTYARVNSLANRFANFLLKKGAEPEKKVLVLLDQDAMTIVMLLGILKSGCAYIPMDREHPADRIRFIITDSEPDFILTTSARAEKVMGAAAGAARASEPGGTGGAGPEPGLILLDREMDEIRKMADTNPDVPVSPGNAAYIIYTSGSTGLPKGVVIEHRSLVSFAKTAAATYDIQPDDRMLQFASISFDASAEEIYPTLYSGAALVIKPQEIVHTPAQFFDFCSKSRLTIIDLPTAYWHLIADQIDTLTVPEGLRLVIIGGDEAHPEKVAKWNRFVPPGIRLLNTYGPTETTVAVTFAELDQATAKLPQVPIGRPFSDVNLVIMNQFMQMAPPGVTGELYIGGPQTARGYLNRQALNRNVFVFVPMVRGSHRFFKTGDLATMLPSGQIIFRGRIDRQVKIRGFRVEPGEIEKTALTHDNVKDCAVAVAEAINEEVTMVCFLVLTETDGFFVDVFKTWLSGRLPDYMIPSAITIVDSLPYTASGKIDYADLKRRIHDGLVRLPSSAGPEGTADAPGTEPLNEYEMGLKKIWEEILAIKDISLNSNFFDSGGSSLLAIRLVTAIEKRFGLSLPVLAVFKFPVLADLAGLLRKNDTAFHFSSVKIIKKTGSKTPVFFIAGTEENTRAYMDQDLADHPFYTVTIFAHKTVGDRIISMDIWEIARRNIHEILQAEPSGPYIIIGFCRYAIVAYEIAIQLSSMGKTVEKLVFIDEFWQKKGHERPRDLHPAPSAPKTGLGNIVRGVLPKAKEKIQKMLLSLHEQRQKLYKAAGRSIPEDLQFRLMESAFWKAYDAYIPLPYHGDALVLDTLKWKEEFDPKLRTYIQGDLKRVVVNATHQDWFDAEQIETILASLQE